ncbi:MAG: large conductance mechanosensitive channel protein MscL [Clostridia bacterium]|nr:large conductance mechanosensitive channel protein MscL [Clostridia bacterium]MBR4799352.1 large conductance mechanosensitive channel protein MscL [Clostridia bacterium]
MAKEKKKGFFGEFKEFIMRGNVLDMAVGVIIATAFGAITSTLINKVLMPLIGYLFGGVDLAKLNITLKDAVIDEAGEVTSEAVVIAIGEFIAAIINFVIVALIVFCIVKAFNRVRNLKKKEEEEAPAEEPAPAEPTVEEKTLETLNQIKELLENK